MLFPHPFYSLPPGKGKFTFDEIIIYVIPATLLDPKGLKAGLQFVTALKHGHPASMSSNTFVGEAHSGMTKRFAITSYGLNFSI